MDHQRIHAHVRRPARHRRPARRHLRAPPRVPHRRRHLRLRLFHHRVRPVRRLPRRLARPPGRRRGADDARHPLDHQQRLPAARARQGDRHLGRRVRDRPGHRPARGRLAHRGRVVARDLLPQRPGRDRRGRDHAVRGRGVAGRDRRPPARLSRHRDADGGPHRARPRPRRGQRLGLGLGPDHRPVRALRRDAGRLRGDRAALPGADRGLRVLPLAPVRGRERRGLPGHVRDVRDVLLPRALHAEHPRLQPAGDRRALPADDADRDGRRPDRRAPVGPHRPARADHRRARADRGRAVLAVAHPGRHELRLPAAGVPRDGRGHRPRHVADERRRDERGRPLQGGRRLRNAVDVPDGRRHVRRRGARRARRRGRPLGPREVAAEPGRARARADGRRPRLRRRPRARERPCPGGRRTARSSTRSAPA